MLLEDVMPDEPPCSAFHQNVCWEVLLSQHAHQAHARGQGIGTNLYHFDGYSLAVTAATVHASMLCEEGKDLLLKSVEKKRAALGVAPMQRVTRRESLDDAPCALCCLRDATR
jgi:hypothetical protein